MIDKLKKILCMLIVTIVILILGAVCGKALSDQNDTTLVLSLGLFFGNILVLLTLAGINV